MNNEQIESLIGTWDFVGDENIDEFMKELGVNLVIRMAAKGIKPRLIIGKNNEKWSIRSESTFKTVGYEFTPEISFEETTPDGRQVTTTIHFEQNKWINVSVDKNGKKSTVTRFIDPHGFQMIEMECGSVKARRWYKRVN